MAVSISLKSHVQKVILFGSRAKGDFKEGSDIDLAIVGKDISLDLLLDIKLQIDMLDLPYCVDVISYENIENLALKKHINRVGKVFFETSKTK